MWNLKVFRVSLKTQTESLVEGEKANFYLLLELSSLMARLQWEVSWGRVTKEVLIGGFYHGLQKENRGWLCLDDISEIACFCSSLLFFWRKCLFLAILSHEIHGII